MKLFLQIMGVGSAILFLIAGFQLISITSISGNSIAESFYHGVGWMSFGLALLSGGLLIGFAEKIEVNQMENTDEVKTQENKYNCIRHSSYGTMKIKQVISNEQE